jgi:methionyl-tRNA formyltransferase
MGTPATALPSLTAILAARHDVVLVCTQPDRPAGRRSAPVPSPVKEFATARGLRVIQPERVRAPAFREAIAASAADVLVVVAYGRILTRPVLDAARHGGVNLHFSLLPAYRGAAPVQWALARGESTTGVTTFLIDEGLDTGLLLGQRSVAIEPEEHAPALLGRLAVEGASLLVETLHGLAAGSIVPQRQDDGAATSAPLLTREHGRWDPAWTAIELAGRVRGFDPWPGVWASHGGKRLRITGAVALPGASESEAPGAILAVDGLGVRLTCADATVARIDAVQPEGGRVMGAREAVNGRLLRPGDRFERPEPTA